MVDGRWKIFLSGYSLLFHSYILQYICKYTFIEEGIMGIPLMIQENDNRRIDHLKKDFGIHKKIDVIRAGLALLEKEAMRIQRISRWKRAAKLVSKSSHEVNKEFQALSRMKD
jgi:hypothetical protein